MKEFPISMASNLGLRIENTALSAFVAELVGWLVFLSMREPQCLSFKSNNALACSKKSTSQIQS